MKTKTTEVEKDEQNIILIPSVSGNIWSYITNQNGNSMRITLEGYGSCTPVEAMQRIIDNMSDDEKLKLSQEIDTKGIQND